MRKRRSTPINCSRTATRWRSARSNLRAASCLRERKRATPAASSKIVRRSTGCARNMASTFPCSIMQYASLPMPVSRNNSRMSRSRTFLAFTKYSLRPSAHRRRSTCTSSLSTGSTRSRTASRRITSPSSGSSPNSSASTSSGDASERCKNSAIFGFSKTKITLAIPAGLREALPAKITSIMAPPRKLFALRSPSTHFTASTTLLLPQPFGPTTPVSGESKRNSVVSAKLLKPLNTSRASRMRPPVSCVASLLDAFEIASETDPLSEAQYP